ncbi:MAG: YidB family protein [Nitrospira sp.]|jgi:uncharacterized protein YidB (DUF937 family)
MGLFDQLGQAAAGMMGSGNQNPLMQAAIGLLGQTSAVGGLAGLIQAFQKNGMGEIVNSWVGTGKNLPISPAQVQQGLGGDLLKQLAAQAGLSSEAASGQLANLLPGLIDKLTPDGKLPDTNLMEQGLNLLRGKLG